MVAMRGRWRLPIQALAYRFLETLSQARKSFVGLRHLPHDPPALVIAHAVANRAHFIRTLEPIGFVPDYLRHAQAVLL